METLHLIGLHGPSRAGKDTTARILQEDFGFEQRAMADAIREILLKLNPLVQDDTGSIYPLTFFVDHQCDGDWDAVKRLSRESTEYMIRLGQACRDILGERVWLDRVLPATTSSTKIVISDCRQPNEYRAIKERGGQIWRISRPGAEIRGMDNLLQGLDFDFHIENRGSLGDLRGQVQAAVMRGMQCRS